LFEAANASRCCIFNPKIPALLKTQKGPSQAGKNVEKLTELKAHSNPTDIASDNRSSIVHTFSPRVRRGQLAGRILRHFRNPWWRQRWILGMVRLRRRHWHSSNLGNKRRLSDIAVFRARPRDPGRGVYLRHSLGRRTMPLPTLRHSNGLLHNRRCNDSFWPDRRTNAADNRFPATITRLHNLRKHSHMPAFNMGDSPPWLLSRELHLLS
jgi:hypothetical protein